MLLDEATSALDVRTERALAAAMDELMKGVERVDTLPLPCDVATCRSPKGTVMYDNYVWQLTHASRPGRTCLVVAHRLATVQRCDVVAFLEAR